MHSMELPGHRRLGGVLKARLSIVMGVVHRESIIIRETNEVPLVPKQQVLHPQLYPNRLVYVC